MEIDELPFRPQLDARAFERGLKKAGQRMNLMQLAAVAAMTAGPGAGRLIWTEREGRQATDEELAAWRARRAQGTPKKRPGHRLARKRKN